MRPDQSPATQSAQVNVSPKTEQFKVLLRTRGGARARSARMAASYSGHKDVRPAAAALGGFGPPLCPSVVLRPMLVDE